jgi:hypothetical protein
MRRPSRFELSPDRADALMGWAQVILIGLLAVIVLVRVGWGA